MIWKMLLVKLHKFSKLPNSIQYENFGNSGVTLSDLRFDDKKKGICRLFSDFSIELT